MDQTIGRTRRRGFPVVRLVIAVSILYLFTEYVWKLLFIGKHVPGIYWLFVAADGSYLLLVAGVGVASVFALITGIVWAANKTRNRYRILGIALALIVSELVVLACFPVILARNTVHMDGIRANGRIYYLAAYPMHDINYALFECDQLGVFCDRIFMSRDLLSADTWPGTLTYQPESNTLSVNAGKESIFMYSPP
jgi:hypothetical protein